MLDLTDQATAILLLSLRIAPAFAFAPPFTLLRIPASVRMMLSIGLALWLVAGHPQQTWQVDFWSQGLFIAALSELFLGIALALNFLQVSSSTVAASVVSAVALGTLASELLALIALPGVSRG